MSYDFSLVNVDTDSITICNKDGSKLTISQIEQIHKDLNDHFPELINWELEPLIDTLVVLKAKNYIMEIDGKVKLKGSSLVDQKKEPILRSLLDDMIKDIIYNNSLSLKDIYVNYIKQALKPNDIKRWCQKKTVTKSVLSCENNTLARKNESDVWNAIKDKQVQEGDKIYVYPTILRIEKIETVLKSGKINVKEVPITGLKCFEDYNNDINTERLIDRVYATVQILSNIVGDDFFIDYNLRKNKDLLNSLTESNNT